jgi:hypothetical protein
MPGDAWREETVGGNPNTEMIDGLIRIFSAGPLSAS